jgi:hypothetical protein
MIFIENINTILSDGKKVIADSIRNCFEDNILSKHRIEDFLVDRLEKFIFKKARIRPIISLKVLILQ